MYVSADSCKKVCPGCHRRHALPKLPIDDDDTLSNPKSQFYTAIPGMVVNRKQWPFVDEMIAKSDDKTLVVSHITYAIKEDAELLELFQPFGEVSSATLRSALGGRFAFVTFVNKEDAEKAMNTLNDGDPRGWDKRVLKVDWASNLKKLT
jgi:hypothetical protein